MNRFLRTRRFLQHKWVNDWLVTPVSALLLALLFRSLLFQPFNIPSESMLPTLQVGDYLFVSKFSYGYGRFSFPYGLLPLEGRLPARDISRGDVIVFRVPGGDDKDYIKRVIGLPGDRIQMIGGVLHINGGAVPKTFVGRYRQSTGDPRTVNALLYRETLPEGKEYLTIDARPNDRYDDTPVYVVPAEHYFVMGDNRDNSADSRVVNGPVGFVPYGNVIGRADLIFFSLDLQRTGGDDISTTPLRFGRFFSLIR